MPDENKDVSGEPDLRGDIPQRRVSSDPMLTADGICDEIPTGHLPDQSARRLLGRGAEGIVAEQRRYYEQNHRQH